VIGVGLQEAGLNSRLLRTLGWSPRTLGFIQSELRPADAGRKPTGGSLRVVKELATRDGDDNSVFAGGSAV